MKTAKELIINLIDSRKINGEEAYTLITSLKQFEYPEYKGITISTQNPIWYSDEKDLPNYKIESK